jgi:hypothetical protein
MSGSFGAAAEAGLPQAGFPHTWIARVLPAPPLIAPARQFVYPLRVPGEEDALARGALLLDVKPAAGANFLAMCALGFRDPAVPSGVFACPRPDDLLAVAGGYGYLVDTLHPESCLHLPVRPVTAILAAPGDGLLLLAGFHSVAAVGADGLAWQSGRLSWEGVAMGEIRDGALHGTGWNMRSDRDVPFVLDLQTGSHIGGGFP